ncbi:anti-sigma factor family protein [Planctomyces sp. SH-PL62]|uniref:anti-sigma factor family protein n=1 Tax=Planctomyces sp. SH-PL62 TaxID=1636152 RepID=UPI00078C624A|nr:hypothetical protein [Planctomyces sp. SH-PL62]AMV39531.1 hypothetical protein VT85_18995 [Planctomyces sp. SH-PL62]
MSSGPEHQRLRPEERANLVAYIDGELNEAESRALSTKLTHSPTARREVDLLKKTWEVLDHLPRPHVNEEFHERTLSYVRQVEIGAGARLAPLAGAASTALKWAACALMVVACGSGGYVVARHLWPDPDERIIRELSLAEHLDEYLEVGGFEPLEALKNSPEFGSGR